jgi:hypothetical protein
MCIRMFLYAYLYKWGITSEYWLLQAENVSHALLSAHTLSLYEQSGSLMQVFRTCAIIQMGDKGSS